MENLVTVRMNGSVDMGNSKYDVYAAAELTPREVEKYKETGVCTKLELAEWRHENGVPIRYTNLLQHLLRTNTAVTRGSVVLTR